MKILFVTEAYPNPVGAGWERRAAQHIRALRRMGEVTVLLPWRNAEGHDPDAAARCLALGAADVLVRTHPAASVATIARHEAAGNRLTRAWLALWRRCYLDSRLPRRHRRGYRQQLRNRFDLVFAFKLQSALWLDAVLPQRERPPLAVVDFDDIETRAFAATVVGGSGHNRFWAWKLRRQLAWLHGVELQLLARWSASCLCSDLDADRLVKTTGAARPWVVPNGYAFGRTLPDPDPGPLGVLFIGTFSYAPNVQAAQWLVEQAWPRVRAAVGEAITLTLAGFSPPAEILALDGKSGIAVVADAPDVAALYAQAGIVVAPILSGSGTRITLIEAAAFRRPIVTTAIGCEGLDFVDGVHAEIADDPAGFADRIVALARSPERRAALTRLAHDHARARFDCEQIERELADRLTGLATRAMPAARPRATVVTDRPIRALFVTGDAHLPQTFGGTQSSTDELITRLIARGHESGLFCALHSGGLFEWRARLQMKLRGIPIAVDRVKGYPVWRTWDPDTQVKAVVDRTRPDVVILQNWNATVLAREFQRHGVPCVFYFRSVQFDHLGGDPSTLPGARFIANSQFTAHQYRLKYGVDCTIIRPTIDEAAYRTSYPGWKVVFVNPVPEKGVDLAIAIAQACPDISFLFLESWSLEPDVYDQLEARLANLANVELRRKTADMPAVYRSARLLLAPSQWQEAWGRIASEAHVSGIPVLGSNRGGLAEAIGPGGIVLAHDAPVTDWVAALRHIWDSPEVWQELSDRARAYARRPELDAERQMDDFIDVLRSAVEQGNSQAR